MIGNRNGMTDEERATVAAGLEAIESALANGSVTATDPAERELQELSLELSALSQAPDPDFARTLDERLAAGFPRSPRTGLAGRVETGARDLGQRARSLAPKSLFAKGRLRRPPMPVLAGAASLLLALGVSAALIAAEDNGSDSSRQGFDGVQARTGASGAPAPVAPDTAARSEALERNTQDEGAVGTEPVPPEQPGGIAPGERDRRVERTAQLTLAAPGDALDRVADKIVGVIERRGGFVLSSWLETGDDGTNGGQFDLRVPATELRATLRELSALGTVRAQSQTGNDRTQAFVSTEDRLNAEKAERASLLKRLENADTDREAEAIRDRLDIVGSEIASLRDQLRDLRERTTYAAISVTLEPKDGSAGAGGDNSTGDALDDAVGSLEDALGIAIRVVGVAIPIALIMFGGWFAGRWLMRRRRESALD